tara:strand:+ start:2244 stop:3524 length:1281 start_codon:yes stop_codon:yes gene_type:complete
MKDLKKISIGVIGLGYVGLPLAVEFSKKYKVYGFDINKTRIDELKKGYDSSLEVSSEKLKECSNLQLTDDPKLLENPEIYIITVPTPVDSSNKPDLQPLISASQIVGKFIKKDNIVIYESTVFPGATEEICVPILEKNSSLKFNSDFFCGYSPERINPGDPDHKLSDILKVVSGSNDKTLGIIDDLYKSIITAGTFKASNIRVAEAAKVIENTQRDLNIALINELSVIFNMLDIDTKEVLEAAGTKWNFLNFSPGLVGGHCIGVDPYYLTHKAEEIGYIPEVILSGRRVNNRMSSFVADEIIKLLLKKQNDINKSKVLVLGATFKENCPDIRNSQVFNLIKEIKSYSVNVDVFDPLIQKNDIKRLKEFNWLAELPISANYNGIILAVPHKEFLDLDKNTFLALKKDKGIIYDIKSVLPLSLVDGRL